MPMTFISYLKAENDHALNNNDLTEFMTIENKYIRNKNNL